MTLFIDDREASQHSNAVELLSIPAEVKRLDAGDYVFLDTDGNPVAIERCEIGNLLQKLRSGELESQLTKCDELYSVIYLLVEGVFDGDLIAVYKFSSHGYYRSYVYPNTHYEYLAGALAGLDRMGIRLLWASTFECSMKVVRAVYMQRTKEQHSLFQKIRPINIPVKMSANPAIPKLLCLCPRLPEKIAIRLINKYGGIWTILNTPDKELLEVEGFGKTLLERLRKNVGWHD